MQDLPRERLEYCKVGMSRKTGSGRHNTTPFWATQAKCLFYLNIAKRLLGNALDQAWWTIGYARLQDRLAKHLDLGQWVVAAQYALDHAGHGEAGALLGGLDN